MMHVARSLFVLLIGIGLIGCEGDGSDAMDWLIGAESQFQAKVEGTLDGTFAGEAYFRTNADGHLVGLELLHGSDSTRGISIEMEPRARSPRTYEVIPASLMHVDRPGAPVGMTAYYEDGQRDFTAVRGLLVVETVEASVINGTFSLHMDGRTSPNQPAQDDLTLTGSFTATPSH